MDYIDWAKIIDLFDIDKLLGIIMRSGSINVRRVANLNNTVLLFY